MSVDSRHQQQKDRLQFQYKMKGENSKIYKVVVHEGRDYNPEQLGRGDNSNNNTDDNNNNYNNSM